MQIADIQEKVIPILREHGVRRASVFGSYVRGEQREDSDIDILVDVPRGTGLFAFIGLQHELENVLGKKVDLGTYKSVHPYLRDAIFKEQHQIL